MRRRKSRPEIKRPEDAARPRRGPARVKTRVRDIEIQHLELELQNHKAARYAAGARGIAAALRRSLRLRARGVSDPRSRRANQGSQPDGRPPAGHSAAAAVAAPRSSSSLRRRTPAASPSTCVSVSNTVCRRSREITVSAGRSVPPLFMHVTSTPLFDEAEKVVECRTTLTDVSAVKRNEERQSLLSDASRLLATSLDNEVGAGGGRPAGRRAVRQSRLPRPGARRRNASPGRAGRGSRRRDAAEPGFRDARRRGPRSSRWSRRTRPCSLPIARRRGSRRSWGASCNGWWGGTAPPRRWSSR